MLKGPDLLGGPYCRYRHRPDLCECILMYVTRPVAGSRALMAPWGTVLAPWDAGLVPDYAVSL